MYSNRRDYDQCILTNRRANMLVSFSVVPVSLTAFLYVQMIQCLIQSTFSLSCKKQDSNTTLLVTPLNKEES